MPGTRGPNAWSDAKTTPARSCSPRPRDCQPQPPSPQHRPSTPNQFSQQILRTSPAPYPCATIAPTSLAARAGVGCTYPTWLTD